MVSDDFDRADNADLGANWSPLSGSCEIVSATGGVNAGVRGTTGGYDWEVWAGNTWNANHASQVTLRTGFTDCGPIVRAAAGPDGYMAMAHWTLGRRIYRRDDGSSTLLSDLAGTVNAGDTIKLDATGTTLDYIHNGSSAGTTTDSTYSGGSAGLYATDQHAIGGTHPEIDDWVGTGEVAGGGSAVGSGLLSSLKLSRPSLVG